MMAIAPFAGRAVRTKRRPRHRLGRRCRSHQSVHRSHHRWSPASSGFRSASRGGDKMGNFDWYVEGVIGKAKQPRRRHQPFERRRDQQHRRSRAASAGARETQCSGDAYARDQHSGGRRRGDRGSSGHASASSSPTMLTRSMRCSGTIPTTAALRHRRESLWLRRHRGVPAGNRPAIDLTRQLKNTVIVSYGRI